MNYLIKIIKNSLLLLTLLLSTKVYSQEIISVLWGFNVASNSANSVRNICDELNKMQNKYKFVLVGKPGAGGSIAANAVVESPNNTLVAMSSSFIIRPYFEQKEKTHNLDNFIPILVQGVGSPLVVGSSKFNSLATAIATPNLTIGVSGMGTVSHLTAYNLSRLMKDATIVFFRSSLDAAIAAAGNHLDLVVAFDPDISSLVESNKLNVLARTGSNSKITGIPEIGQLTANYAIYASTSMDKEKFLEIHKLMAVANTRQSVLDSYKIDLLTPVVLNLDQSRQWYSSERQFWKRQVEKIVTK